MYMHYNEATGKQHPNYDTVNEASTQLTTVNILRSVDSSQDEIDTANVDARIAGFSHPMYRSVTSGGAIRGSNVHFCAYASMNRRRTAFKGLTTYEEGPDLLVTRRNELARSLNHRSQPVHNLTTPKRNPPNNKHRHAKVHPRPKADGNCHGSAEESMAGTPLRSPRYKHNGRQEPGHGAA